MKGTKHISVRNRNATFKMELHRNITIILGESGTGKTTLYQMIADHTRLGDKSGVTISSENKCVALIDLDWENQLSSTSNSVVFIDEGFVDLNTKKFASMVKNSDNYYVIINREALHELPYSVDEIYEIKASGKFHTLTKKYSSSKKHIYQLKDISNKRIDI